MAIGVEVVLATDQNFWPYVTELWNAQEWQPHSHTRSALKYYAQRPIDVGFGVNDVSFVVTVDNRPAFGFLGALVAAEGGTDLKAYEIPCLCLDAQQILPATALDRFLTEIARLISQVNGAVFVRDFLQRGFFSPLAQYLLRCGAKLKTHTYQLIDLDHEELFLWRDLRKSYKSLVNWGGRELRIEFMDADNADWSGMNAFRELHIRVAGRETRSVESWRNQYQWIVEGGAFLVFGWKGEDLVTVGMFTYTKSMCTYFSSASRRDLFEKPMFHALMWRSIMRAKSLGCRWFDVNEKYFFNNPIIGCQDEKLMSISEFKLGFGGALKAVVDLELGVRPEKEFE